MNVIKDWIHVQGGWWTRFLHQCVEHEDSGKVMTQIQQIKSSSKALI